jgi:hypothetical protein
MLDLDRDLAEETPMREARSRPRCGSAARGSPACSDVQQTAGEEQRADKRHAIPYRAGKCPDTGPARRTEAMRRRMCPRSVCTGQRKRKFRCVMVSSKPHARFVEFARIPAARHSHCGDRNIA